jgi:uncharacterized repeat protein (TIGR01451 family)/MYXO-CTERM domain-containing protein
MRYRRSSSSLGLIVGLASASLCLVASEANAAPTQRFQVDQHGDFVLVGNTLGHECAAGTVAPIVGTVGNCGNNTGDSSPDIFWRSDAPAAGQAQANNTITVAQARSTSVLALPAGATVTYARLYWAAANGGTADTQVTIERPGGGGFPATNITADDSFTSGNNTYQSTADITSLVQTNGVGAYRLSGVDSNDLVNDNNNNNFAAWWMVVIYEDPAEAPRNITIFDGLDAVSGGNSAAATLSGFLVPNAGFTARLGVVSYEGDGSIQGDSLRFGTGNLGNADRLSDATNPIDDFFNGSRSRLGIPVTTVGDLPQLAGTARSMSGFDMDVVDITNRVTAGQTSANIEATSTGDVYYLGAFITSISTFKPDFTTTTKTFQDVNGGSILPGDEIKYTITMTNTGNDTGINTVMTDQLPVGVTYKPGSLQIVSGPNAGAKTDAAGDDQGNYTAGTRTVTVRLGAGANATQGGTVPIGGTTVVSFSVTVDATATGTISNQALVTSQGLLGAPSDNWVSDGNGNGSGQPPTDIVVDQCVNNTQCPAAKPICDTTPNPNVCVQCLTSANCSGNTPVCNTATKTCGACTNNSQCSGSTPACQTSGACGQCNSTNSSQCTGNTPVCNNSQGVCVQCNTNAQCSGATPICDTPNHTCVQCLNSSQCPGTAPVCNTATKVCAGCASDMDCNGNTPACQPSGSCGECSATNTTQCTGAKPTCDVMQGICIACQSDMDCGGLTPTCNTGSGACECVAMGAEVCGNAIDEDCDGALDNGCVDSDGDGLFDTVEIQIGTNPNDADSDDDGVLDGQEPDFDKDTDGDGLINALDPDSDNDGLFDGTELGLGCSNAATDTSKNNCRADADNGATKTDPLKADTDNGGIPDGQEDINLNGMIDMGEKDPNNPADDVTKTDSDNDGLTDDFEIAIGSDPNDADSDDDGVIDGQEPNPTADSDGDGIINVLDPDSDNDGLYDGTEMGLDCSNPATDKTKNHCRADADMGATKTSPVKADTDNGGVIDGSEDFNLNGRVDMGETDPTAGHGADDSMVVDSDGDGLSDGLEIFIGSNPNDADSDDDGVPDGQEPNFADDTDGDGLINILDVDSDNDGLYDGTEMGLDCSNAATDTTKNHCTPDGDMGATKTNPLNADTDRGGASDGSEDFNLNGVVDAGETDPTSGHGADDSMVVDSDGDGLSDGLETFIGSNPNDADSDDDGLPDGAEPNPSDDNDGDGKRNINDADSDGDGLFDGTEAGRDCSDAATDPTAMTCIGDADMGATKTGVLNPDTDRGGVSDGDEDTNKNGQVDAGERDPNNGADDNLMQPCTTDPDCGGPMSGVICENNTCEMGCRGVGGNGCPTGEMCTSTTMEKGTCVPTGMGGMGGSAGSAGTAGGSGTAGAGNAGTAGTSVAGSAGTTGTAGSSATGGTAGSSAGSAGSSAAETSDGSLEGGGCGCRVTSNTPASPISALLALGACVGLVRRRRRTS